MSEKNILEIKFGFYSGRNPRSFWKCGGVCVCVWIEIVADTVFCSAKAQFWMISESILIPKIYARLQEIASNFSKFSGGDPQTQRIRDLVIIALYNSTLYLTLPYLTPRWRSVRGFAPLPGPPFKNSWIRPWHGSCSNYIVCQYESEWNLSSLSWSI